MLRFSRVFENVVLKRSIMSAKIFDGNLLAMQIQNEVKCDIENWMKNSKRQPTLVTILVGCFTSKSSYTSAKLKACEYVGIKHTICHFEESLPEEEVIEKIHELNDDSEVDGISIHLPLPEYISKKKLYQCLKPSKDVEGVHPTNMANLAMNIESYIPSTALAVCEILKKMEIDTFGKHVVLCGRSKNVGLPIALLLHSDKSTNDKNMIGGLEATTTICHRNTPKEQLKSLTQIADIVITATGVPNLIRSDMIKKGACVVDVGCARIQSSDRASKWVGDVNFDEVSKVAGWLTPVPGGVGPVAVAMLMKNTIKAAKLNEIK